jgi:quinol monooxygenase YgiN
MTIIVAGSVDFAAGTAEPAILGARPHIDAAYAEPGCLCYAWTLDPLAPGRVRVFEEWDTQDNLAAHLAGAAYRAMLDHLRSFTILGATTRKYRVYRSCPVYDAQGVPRADFFE